MDTAGQEVVGAWFGQHVLCCLLGGEVSDLVEGPLLDRGDRGRRGVGVLAIAVPPHRHLDPVAAALVKMALMTEAGSGEGELQVQFLLGLFHPDMAIIVLVGNEDPG